jgi:hypothetical protein
MVRLCFWFDVCMNLYIAVVLGAGCCHSLRGMGWLGWAILEVIGMRQIQDKKKRLREYGSLEGGMCGSESILVAR